MKLKYGLIGGGNGGFIGGVHRRAADFDFGCDMVAGCFSRNEKANHEAGALWGVLPERTYRSYQEMAETTNYCQVYGYSPKERRIRARCF